MAVTSLHREQEVKASKLVVGKEDKEAGNWNWAQSIPTGRWQGPWVLTGQMQTTYSKQNAGKCLQMPGRKLNFERVFDETWLGFLRSERGLWGLFVQTGVRATYISST